MSRHRHGDRQSRLCADHAVRAGSDGDHPAHHLPGRVCPRLRQARPGGGTAILAQVTTAVSAYLADERDRGRIAADADIDSLTFSLVGGGHLLFSDREPGPPSAATVTRFVATVLADVLQRRPR